MNKYIIKIKEKNLNTTMFVVLFLCIVLKLFLVSQSEIYLSSGDNLTYVYFADHGYWGTPFLPDRPPVTSLWMMLSNKLGVRFRMLQEVLFLTSTGLMAMALSKCRSNRLVSLLFFVIVIYAPIANYHLDFAMADGLYMCLNLLLVAVMIFLLLAPTKRQKILLSTTAGFVASAMILTRVEYEYVLIIVFAVCSLEFYTKKENIRVALITASTVAFLIMVPVVFFVLIVSWEADKSWGYFGVPNFITKGESKVMKQLMRIDGGHDGLYMPITPKARALAFEASPEFNKWRDVIEDPFVIKLSEDYTGVSGSLDTQRYLPLLKRIGQSSAYPGLFGDVDLKIDRLKVTGLREAELTVIASELNKALEEGRLPKRPAPFSLVDPVINKWIGLIPKSLSKLTGLLVSSPPPWVDMQGYGLLKRESERMTRVLNRDVTLTQKGPMKGLLTVRPGKEIVGIDLYVNALIFPMFAQFDKFPSERISTGKIAKKSETEYLFEFPPTNERWVPVTLALHIIYSDGSNENISHLEVGPTITIRPDQKDGVVAYCISEFSPIISEHQSLSYGVQNVFAKIYPFIIYVFSGFIGLFFCWSCLRYLVCRRNLVFTDTSKLFLILCFMFIVFISRFILLCVVDVAAWHVDVRYLAPVFPVFIAMIVIVYLLIIDNFNKAYFINFIRLRDKQ